jgi:uncharacterized damage-inducible protein DinB
MNTKTQSIIRNLQSILGGEPWFGRAVFPILEEVDEAKVYTNPACPAGRPNGTEHSLIELLYHMITWAEFSLKQSESASPDEIKEVENRDWRKIDPDIHTWKNGMEQLKKIHEQIISILETKDDAFLSEKVEQRTFNYRFMLSGLIQHNIYHLGQIACLKKMLA